MRSLADNSKFGLTEMDRVTERHKDWWCVLRHIQRPGEIFFASEKSVPADPFDCIELLYRPGLEINLEITQPTPPGHVREGVQRVLGILEGHQQTSKRDGTNVSRAI